MKTITSNLLQFTFCFSTATIAFFYALSWSIGKHSALAVWTFAGMYFIFNLITGWFFAKRDYRSYPFFDMGIRYHLVTFFVFIGLWELWILFKVQSPFEKAGSIHMIAFIWGAILLCHLTAFLHTRKKIVKIK